MATSGTYYIDTADFSTATAVWTNTTLTTKAPDGYYSFGGNYRQQFEGLLQAIESCSVAPSTICYEVQNNTNVSGECFGCTGTYASQSTTAIRFLDGCEGTAISPTSNMTVVVTYSNGGTETTEINSGSPATYTTVGSSETICGPDCTEIASPTVVSVQVTNQSEEVIPQCCAL